MTIEKEYRIVIYNTIKTYKQKIEKAEERLSYLELTNSKKKLNKNKEYTKLTKWIVKYKDVYRFNCILLTILTKQIDYLDFRHCKVDVSRVVLSKDKDENDISNQERTLFRSTRYITDEVESNVAFFQNPKRLSDIKRENESEKFMHILKEYENNGKVKEDTDKKNKSIRDFFNNLDKPIYKTLYLEDTTNEELDILKKAISKINDYYTKRQDKITLDRKLNDRDKEILELIIGLLYTEHLGDITRCYPINMNFNQFIKNRYIRIDNKDCILKYTRPLYHRVIYHLVKVGGLIYLNENMDKTRRRDTERGYIAKCYGRIMVCSKETLARAYEFLTGNKLDETRYKRGSKKRQRHLDREIKKAQEKENEEIEKENNDIFKNFRDNLNENSNFSFEIEEKDIFDNAIIDNNEKNRNDNISKVDNLMDTLNNPKGINNNMKYYIKGDRVTQKTELTFRLLVRDYLNLNREFYPYLNENYLPQLKIDSTRPTSRFDCSKKGVPYENRDSRLRMTVPFNLKGEVDLSASIYLLSYIHKWHKLPNEYLYKAFYKNIYNKEYICKDLAKATSMRFMFAKTSTFKRLLKTFKDLVLADFTPTEISVLLADKKFIELMQKQVFRFKNYELKCRSKNEVFDIINKIKVREGKESLDTEINFKDTQLDLVSLLLNFHNENKKVNLFHNLFKPSKYTKEEVNNLRNKVLNYCLGISRVYNYKLGDFDYEEVLFTRKFNSIISLSKNLSLFLEILRLIDLDKNKIFDKTFWSNSNYIKYFARVTDNSNKTYYIRNYNHIIDDSVKKYKEIYDNFRKYLGLTESGDQKLVFMYEALAMTNALKIIIKCFEEEILKGTNVKLSKDVPIAIPHFDSIIFNTDIINKEFVEWIVNECLIKQSYDYKDFFSKSRYKNHLIPKLLGKNVKEEKEYKIDLTKFKGAKFKRKAYIKYLDLLEKNTTSELVG